MKERLQKLISAAGLMSRRAAEEKIRAGLVTVNGRTAKLGDSAESGTDDIRVEGRRLSFSERKRTILLYKPRGYVTTLSDEKGRRNVTDLLRGVPERLYPVGRLDMYSEGLLLMTNDGEFANRMMHPSHERGKCYRVWVSGEDIPGAASRLGQSMDIDGYRIRPAAVTVERQEGKNAVLLITIHEGRNRQIRKMCDAAGLRLTRLCRIAEGGITLGELKPGQWRELSEEEISLCLGEGAADGNST